MPTELPDFPYTEVEWQQAVGHGPLGQFSDDYCSTLHRHWMWANLQRSAFYDEFAGRDVPNDFTTLADRQSCAMLLWYGLLYAVIESVREHNIDLRGGFEQDIAYVENTLRKCRNAVFHVSRDAYYDQRIVDFIVLPGAVAGVRAVSTGFGRLFLEELRRRRK